MGSQVTGMTGALEGQRDSVMDQRIRGHSRARAGFFQLSRGPSSRTPARTRARRRQLLPSHPTIALRCYLFRANPIGSWRSSAMRWSSLIVSAVMVSG